MENEKLAIVIPAYKLLFFEQTLKSLADQTCHDFIIYVGDDNSPDDLKAICDKFSESLNIIYKKFENNIGAKNLVIQWKRCVELAKNEKWIWLFSDDDLAERNCVEVFYNTIKNDSSKCEVYRFNTIIINDSNQVIGTTPESPFIDTSENMAFEILMGRRGNSMPDHIFSREVYNRNNGFVYTDYAQSADWGTSILFSKDNGICSMKGAKVKWRLGNSNISGKAKKKNWGMVRGYFQFLRWLINHFRYLLDEDRQEQYQKLIKATKYNMLWVVKDNYKSINMINYKDVLSFYNDLYNSNITALFMTNLFYARLHIWPVIKKLKFSYK